LSRIAHGPAGSAEENCRSRLRRHPDHGKDPERTAEMVAEIYRYQITDAPLEVAVDGYTEPDYESPRAYYEQARAPG
jgi:hypothetical protein